jgi:hypothetical protein
LNDLKKGSNLFREQSVKCQKNRWNLSLNLRIQRYREQSESSSLSIIDICTCLTEQLLFSAHTSHDTRTKTIENRVRGDYRSVSTTVSELLLKTKSRRMRCTCDLWTTINFCNSSSLVSSKRKNWLLRRALGG